MYTSPCGFIVSHSSRTPYKLRGLHLFLPPLSLYNSHLTFRSRISICSPSHSSHTPHELVPRLISKLRLSSAPMCLLINRFVTLPLQLTHSTSTIFNTVLGSPTAHTPCSGVPCHFSVIPSPALPYFVVIENFSALTIAYALRISISPNRFFRHPLSRAPLRIS